MALSTGRNNISKAMIRLSAPSGIQFQTDETDLEGDGELLFKVNMFQPPLSPPEADVNFETIDGSIVLFDLAENSTIRLSVPHTDASAYHAMVSVRTANDALGAYDTAESEHHRRLCYGRGVNNNEDCASTTGYLNHAAASCQR